tara:strand:+ start:759 stop:1991 length:1233 start_codon:yes stop_codon:yes gene_type:complete
MGVYNPKTDASYKKRWKNENIKEYKEAVFDRISEILINKFDQISSITNQDIEDFQKTWRDGRVVSGRNSEDIMVVYQSDTDANGKDQKIIDIMMDWLEFTHPKYISVGFETVVTKEGTSKKELVFKAPGKHDLKISSFKDDAIDKDGRPVLEGYKDIRDVNLKDNVSQFLNFAPEKTNIDKTKLEEHVNIDFSELSPKTRTAGISTFQKNKKSVPFYRYRCEDFFGEYFLSKEVPPDYRILKFFEYFELVVDNITIGNLEDVGDIIDGADVIPEESILYLFSECKKRLPHDSEGNPIDPWEDLFDEIQDLKFELDKCVKLGELKDVQIEQLEKHIAAASGDTELSLKVSDPKSPEYNKRHALHDPALDSSSAEFDQIEFDDAVDDSSDASVTAYFNKKRRKLKRRRWFRK